MKLDSKGYDLIKEFEGFSDRPYKCSDNIPTIGYGNTFYPDGKRVSMLDKQITKEYADEIFKNVVDTAKSVAPAKREKSLIDFMASGD